jgi:hypothetical protein
MTDVVKMGEAMQKLSKDGLDAAVHSFGEVHKNFEALVARATENAKTAFEDTTRTFEQLLGAKSVEQAIEIQTQYAKRAYDNYVAEMSKLGEWYVAVVHNGSKRFEQAAKKTA